MAAGAGFTPTEITSDIEPNYVCMIVAGVPTTFLQVNEYDDTGDITSQKYFGVGADATTVPYVPNPTELASLNPGGCNRIEITATVKLGGPGVTPDLAPDGATWNAAALPVGMVLVSVEGVVESGDNPASPVTGNRVELVNPGSGAGAGLTRVLSQGESWSDHASSGSHAIATAPAYTVTCLGTSRVYLRYSYRAA